MSGGLVVVREKDRHRLVGIYSGALQATAPCLDRAAAADEVAAEFTAELGWVTKSDALGTVIATAPKS
jgi:hypothetical protein